MHTTVSSGSPTVGRRGRALLALASAAALVAAGTIGSGTAAAAPAAPAAPETATAKLRRLLSAPPATSNVDLGRLQESLARRQKQAQPALIAASVAHRARIGTAAARAERRRSRTAFAGLAPANALALTRQQFSREVAAVSAVPADALDADRVLGYRDAHTAIVDPAGPRGPEVAVSTGAPFRVHGGDLDLDLVRGGGAWTPRNAAVDVTIPDAADGTLRVGEDLGVTVSIPGGDGAAPGRALGDASVFYGEAGTATDLVAAPTPGGLETFFTLRGAAAPEDATLTLDLPRGARLIAGADGSVRIVRGGRTIGRIAPPSAVDAQGTPVPVSMTTDGDAVTVHTDHHGADVAYPVLVDPIIDSLDDPPNGTDPVETDEEGIIIPTDGRWHPAIDDPMFADTGTLGDGLYITDPAGPGVSRGGFWMWFAPDAITQADFTYDLVLNGDTTSGDSGPLAVGFLGAGGQVYDQVDTPTTSGTSTLYAEDETGDPSGDVALFMMWHLQFGGSTYTAHDHTAFLSGAVFHFGYDGPELVDLPPSGGDIGWSYANEPVPLPLKAVDAVSGIKRIEVTAQSGTDPEILLDAYDAACAATPVPCPSPLEQELAPDFSLLDEGTYTLRIRAINGHDEASTDWTATFGIDRTAPDVGTLGGDVGALNGLTTASTAALTLSFSPTDALSGVRDVQFDDSESQDGGYGECATIDCDPAELTVHMDQLSDGEHTITAHAWDNAGNETTDDVTFTVDRP